MHYYIFDHISFQTLFKILPHIYIFYSLSNMSSNGSNDAQVARIDSLFGSQGNTRNFTSLLNPSYLQASNGKESHKRETDGKCFYMVIKRRDEVLLRGSISIEIQFVARNRSLMLNIWSKVFFLKKGIIGCALRPVCEVRIYRENICCARAHCNT